MSISLYAAFVSPCLRMVTNMQALVRKAEAFCAENGVEAQDIIEARLAADMNPFSYQVKSVTVHSLGAIEGVKRGVFSPDRSTPPDSFGALLRQLADTRDALSSITPPDMEALVGKPMRFEIKNYYADYEAESFLTGFSLPNFYFHATTAYDILRGKGLLIGKVDYLGKLALTRGD